MISGRCSILLTVRYVSELLKNRYLAPAAKRGCSRRTPHTLALNLTRMASTSKDNAMATKAEERGKKNRLALEKSPYLLQHASNPVQWYPWGDEALEKARKEDKLIFLSVGYSTCHWCHVMERESFENPEIADVMNKNFVNIKVDREERPDIDRIYMTFVQTISGHGGWPMSVFLAPDLTPITGGTYFPPEDRFGHPGFKSVLLGVSRKWRESKQDLMLSGKNILEALKRAIDYKGPGTDKNELSPEDCGRKCAQQLTRGYEVHFGGFTDAPKFPQPVNFNFLFHMYARNSREQLNQQCMEMSVYTLTKMAQGGIHDHVGQGFARYSVDSEWHVPHFEKMLYDQGQLLQSYADAFLATKDPFFAEIVDDIATYVIRDLRHKEGGFYSAEDADSLPTPSATEKKEGAFYVWTYDEITDLLSKETSGEKKIKLSDLFCFHYNVKVEGNVRRYQDPHGELTRKNVLIVYEGIEKTAEHFGLTAEATKNYLRDCRKILFDARSKRPRPHLDDKIVTAWNGLMISGLSRAGAATNNKEYIKLATEAGRFIEKYLFDKSKGLLLRSCYRGDGDTIMQTSVPIYGFHGDYAFVVKGFLDLYEADFDSHWLEFAEKLQDTQDELFWDAQNGGYFSTTKDDPTIILRLKDDHDGAEPSSNSVACGNLLRLADFLDRNEFREKAGRLLDSFKESLMRVPIAFPELVSMLLHYKDSMTRIYIVGKRDDDDVKELIRVVQDRLIPSKILFLVDHDDRDNILFRKNELAAKIKQKDGRATAYICKNRTCSLPVTTPDELSALLTEEL